MLEIYMLQQALLATGWILYPNMSAVTVGEINISYPVSTQVALSLF